ncbi:hypothetical protein [Aerosakkonema funiforme]|uniref:hypothetical protein n=1 Tax=Aerosakkonema funiforme TaxID=1246630 RepID=UPI0035B78CE8
MQKFISLLVNLFFYVRNTIDFIIYKGDIKRLGLSLRAAEVADGIIAYIQEENSKGKIKYDISKVIVKEVKKNLINGNLIYQIKRNRPISIKVRSHLVENSDIKNYYFPVGMVYVTIYIEKQYQVTAAIALILVVCILLGVGFNFFYHSQQQKNITQLSTKIYFKFPMNYCGEPSSGGSNTWYPVYVSYTKMSLKRVRTNFCCDAYYDLSAKAIQVASFYSKSKAYGLVKELKNKGFINARVGIGSTINTLASSKRQHICR